MYKPIITRKVHGGVQKIYKFDNGYGASVVRHDFSYGAEKGKWELAVIEFTGEENEFSISYSTPITDDVIGHLSQKEVNELLGAIEALDPPTK